MPSSPSTPPPADEAPLPTAPPGPAARLLRFWPYLGISLIWLVVAVVFAGQQTLASGLPFSETAPLVLVEWLPWVVLSPVLFAVATRFTPVPGRRLRACAINLLAALVAIAAAELLFIAVVQPKPRGENRLGPTPPDAPQRRAVRPDRDFDRERPPPPRFEEDFGDYPPPPPPRRRGQAPDGPRLGRPPGPAGPETGQPPGHHTALRHLVHFHLPLALVVVMAAQANAAFLGLRQRERRAAELAASLAQAKLSALQSQLQPHFLFNALNAIATVVHRDPVQADEMINNLADLLRRSLTAGKRPEATLGEELDHLAAYLSIERVRFGDRLQVDWRVDEAARPALIPVLALQPILENAVKHGVERRRETVGRIVVAATADAGRLRVSVTDNGPGPDLDSSAAPAPARPGHGIGLANTRARLHALHGDAASVTLEPAAGGGCRVTVSLPLRFSSTPSPAE